MDRRLRPLRYRARHWPLSSRSDGTEGVGGGVYEGPNTRKQVYSVHWYDYRNEIGTRIFDKNGGVIHELSKFIFWVAYVYTSSAYYAGRLFTVLERSYSATELLS